MQYAASERRNLPFSLRSKEGGEGDSLGAGTPAAKPACPGQPRAQWPPQGAALGGDKWVCGERAGSCGNKLPGGGCRSSWGELGPPRLPPAEVKAAVEEEN